MNRHVMVYPDQKELKVLSGTNLLVALRDAGLAPEAPCGGHGTCGKCQVLVDGEEKLACQVMVDADICVKLPVKEQINILSEGTETAMEINPIKEGYLAAFDIGTTTVVCYLLDGVTGKVLAHASVLNPQAPYGADVISRIQAALDGQMDTQTEIIRRGMSGLISEVCRKAGINPEEISVVSVVANPCMQQLFMGISPENLAAVPFDAVLNKIDIVPAADYLPECKNAVLPVIPNISGYVGSDTVGCVISTDMDHAKDICLMVDIGTNGEMVLSKRGRMTACSTAAGPALEGAKIHFGMRGAPGAIDHVRAEDGMIRCSVIGDIPAAGICGSGLIDAVAVMLELGIINKRGRIQTGDKMPEYTNRLQEIDGTRVFYLTEEVYLTQDDIREVQLAKGAIAAGIELMAEHLELRIDQIDSVMLAGAFGSFMNPDSACRIGLLPAELKTKITAVGNAAGSGSRIVACDREQLERTQDIVEKVEFIELAALPKFQKCFAMNTNF